MRDLIDIFMKRFGFMGVVRIFFYPLTVLVTTPVRLIQTLWRCRILIDGRWGSYSHFTPYTGIMNLCYWTAALNLYRFGRTGYCPYIGMGNYPLSRWFHHTLISLYFYWGASTITLLVGMFGWSFSHLVWISHVDAGWVLLIIFLATISTTFYANIFVLQNYNVVGWMFFPLGIYGMYTGNWLVACFSWFFASFGSFTVVFIAGIISVGCAIVNFSIVPIFTLIPAFLKLSLHFYPFLAQKNVKFALLSIMKALGLYNKGTKYKYKYPPKVWITVGYFLLIYGQFFALLYMVTGRLPVIFFIGLVIFMANSTYFRFADVQSTQMLMFSLATVEIIQNPSALLLLSYWILISPLPVVIPFPFMKSVLDVVPKLEPFSIRKFFEDMENFLSPVNAKGKILMVFDSPNKSEFFKLFDGYSSLLELALHISSKKRIHFMPDFWGVFSLNYEGAPDLWGRDPKSVVKNIKFCKADYVVIYQNTGTKLDSQWDKAGFEVLNRFSWADYEKELRGVKPYLGETPDWWLLKIPSTAIVK